jgi:MFS family permease
MVIFTRKREIIHLSGMAKLGVVSFISLIGISAMTSIWAVYLDGFLKSSALVGLITAVLSLVAFGSYFVFIPLMEKLNKEKIYLYSIFAILMSYLLFTFVQNIYLVIATSVVLFVATTLRYTSFGIIVKDKSSKTKLSKNEGVIYTFANTAWVIGPLIAGLVVSRFGTNYVFLFAALFLLMAMFVFKQSKIKDHNSKKRADRNMYRNFKDFFKDSKRIKSYILAGGVSFWWVLIYIYMPLYIVEQGLPNSWIGYFLFAVPIPLILFECRFSSFAGKYGFKKMFKYGYLIAFFSSLICFFLTDIYLIFLFLILGSVGLAMIEPTRDAYFFDICKGKEHLRFYGPFNTSIDTFKIIAKLLPALLLLYFDFRVVFLFFSLVMFLLYLLSFRIKDVVESKRRKRRKKGYTKNHQ